MSNRSPIYPPRQSIRRKRADVERMSSVHSLLKRKHDMIAKTRAAGARTTTDATMLKADMPLHMRLLRELLHLVRPS